MGKVILEGGRATRSRGTSALLITGTTFATAHTGPIGGAKKLCQQENAHDRIVFPRLGSGARIVRRLRDRLRRGRRYPDRPIRYIVPVAVGGRETFPRACSPPNSRSR